jgi:flagellar motor switch protein FliM
VALPAAVSNALLRKLTQQASYRRQRGPADTAKILRHLERCAFPMELLLPEGRVRVSQLLALQYGNVLKLGSQVSQTADVWVNGKKLFHANPVRMGTRRAAQVTERVHTAEPVRKENA